MTSVKIHSCDQPLPPNLILMTFLLVTWLALKGKVVHYLLSDLKVKHSYMYNKHTYLCVKHIYLYVKHSYMYNKHTYLCVKHIYLYVKHSY